MFNITAAGTIYETLLGWRVHCKCCLFKILTGKWAWSIFNLLLFWQLSVNLSLNSQSLSRQSSSLWTVSLRKELVDNMFILLLQYYKNIWSQWQQRKISGWQILTMYLIVMFIAEEHSTLGSSQKHFFLAWMSSSYFLSYMCFWCLFLFYSTISSWKILFFSMIFLVQLLLNSLFLTSPVQTRVFNHLRYRDDELSSHLFANTLPVSLPLWVKNVLVTLVCLKLL